MEETYTLRTGSVRIPCKHSLPDHHSPRRIVLCVHGLGGSYDDPLQQALAEEMDLFYCAVYRFCLPCHGASELSGSKFTLRACIDSLLAVAADAVAAHPEADCLCIFATGFGAYLTLAAMDDLLKLNIPMRLVLQTPPVRMDLTLLTMCRTDVQTLWALGEAQLPTIPPLTVTYDFFQELVEHFAVNACPVPMLILHSPQDPLIRMDDIMALRNLNDQAQLVLLDGPSLQFREEAHWGIVLDLTRDWFEYGQVLLCDCL